MQSPTSHAQILKYVFCAFWSILSRFHSQTQPGCENLRLWEVLPGEIFSIHLFLPFPCAFWQRCCSADSSIRVRWVTALFPAQLTIALYRCDLKLIGWLQYASRRFGRKSHVSRTVWEWICGITLGSIGLCKVCPRKAQCLKWTFLYVLKSNDVIFTFPRKTDRQINLLNISISLL